ncbi:hypothetical protein [Vibrio phage phiKT1024]|nr:hypothetical protein [Vibrio phage phiKT1024]
MYKIEDFKPGTLLYLQYNFDKKNQGRELNTEGVYICEVYKIESGPKPFHNKIWVNDIWTSDGELGEKEFIYLDDFNSNDNKHIHILIDEYHHPDLTKLISEHPEVQEVLNFMKAIYPEHFV